MKSSTFFAVVGILLTAFVAVNADDSLKIPEGIKEAVGEIIAACKDKISPEDLAKMLKAPASMSSNENFNCFKACALTHLKLMSGGKVQMDKIEEKINAIAKESEKEMASKVLEAIKPCVEEANKNDDECKVAGSLSECIHKLDMFKP